MIRYSVEGDVGGEIRENEKVQGGGWAEADAVQEQMLKTERGVKLNPYGGVNNNRTEGEGVEE